MLPIADIPRIAVVVHLYHVEQWAELAAYIRNVPKPFELFVTLCAERLFVRARILQSFPEARIIERPNRGRDVAPFLSLFPELASFDLVCKIHTKLDRKRRRSWRFECLQSVLGSSALVLHILETFTANPRLMLAGSRHLYLDGPANVMKAGPLLAASGADVPSSYGFFAGTMFWMRPGPFASLADLFPPSAFVAHDDNDAHPEHVLERLFGAQVAARGGQVALIDNRGTDATIEVGPATSGLVPSFRAASTNILPARYAALSPAWNRHWQPFHRRLAGLARQRLGSLKLLLERRTSKKGGH